MFSPTRRITRRFYRPWYSRPFVWLMALALALVAGRLALTPWLETRTRAALERAAGADVRFARMEVFLFPPVLVVHDLSVRSEGAEARLEVPRTEIHGRWRDLLAREAPTVSVRLRKPALHLSRTDRLAFGPLLESLPAARIDVLAVEEGSAYLAGAPEAQGPWLGRIQGRARSLATRAELAPPAEPARRTGAPAQLPTSIDGTAELLGMAKLEVRSHAALFAPSPALAGTFSVDGLGLRDLEALLGTRVAGAPPAAGTVAVDARVELQDGALTGKMAAKATNATLGPSAQALAQRLEATLAGVVPALELKVAELSAERAPDDPMPLSGRVTPGAVGPIEALLGVTRALVVQGLEAPLRSAPLAAAAPSESPGAVVAAEGGASEPAPAGPGVDQPGD
jgi:hypothetical protein